MKSGTVSRAAVEALLTRAGAGDAEAAEVAGRLYDRGIGVKWDPPSALRWYAVAALAGSDSAKREAGRLWRVMPPVSQRRAEAVLARFFTDAELAGINLGPVRRPTTQRSWMTNLEAAWVPRSAAPGPSGNSGTGHGPATGCGPGRRCRAGAGTRPPCPSRLHLSLSRRSPRRPLLRQRSRHLPRHYRRQRPQKLSSLLRPANRVRRTPSRLPRSCRFHIPQSRVLRFHWRNRSAEPKRQPSEPAFPDQNAKRHAQGPAGDALPLTLQAGPCRAGPAPVPADRRQAEAGHGRSGFPEPGNGRRPYPGARECRRR